MSAAIALKAARAAGVELRIDGDDLLLEASAAPPPAVLDLLMRYKTHIVAMLRQQERVTGLGPSRPLRTSETDERSASIEEAGNTTGAKPTIFFDPRPTLVHRKRWPVPIAAGFSTYSTGCPPRAMTRATGSSLGRGISSLVLGFQRRSGADGPSRNCLASTLMRPLDHHEQWGLIVGLALAPKLEISSSTLIQSTRQFATARARH